MRAYLGLGANLGDRRAALDAAAAALEREGVRVVARSSIYETDPVGGPPQPPYLNQALAVESDLSPRDLLDVCLRVEAALGRDRSGEERWGPRPLDVDVLVIEGVVIDEPGLTVPHPRLAERAFVLVPLAEIAPGLGVPGLGEVAALLAALGEVTGVRRFG